MKTVKKYFYLLVALVLFSCATAFTVQQKKSVEYVPDAETAKKIAEAIWLPIYGTNVLNEKPYNAELKMNVWIVTGTLKDELGGVAYIEIQKSDCKILKVTHGK